MAGGSIRRWATALFAFLIAVAHAPVAAAPQAQEAAAGWPTTVIPKTAPETAPAGPPADTVKAKPAGQARMATATAAALVGDDQRTSFRLDIS
jgi:hypothetical protein